MNIFYHAMISISLLFSLALTKPTKIPYKPMYSTVTHCSLFQNCHYTLLRCPSKTDLAVFNDKSTDINADAMTDDIHPEEVMFGRVKEKDNPRRLSMFIGGRIALRRSLSFLKLRFNDPILTDEHGAPQLPTQISGTITHKDRLVAAAVMPYNGSRVGIDLERCTNKIWDRLMTKILTEKEQETIGKLSNVPLAEQILLNFSFKESAFKALHPFLKRSISFTEISIEPKENGTAEFDFSTMSNTEKFNAEGYWKKMVDDDISYFLTCVSVTPVDNQT